MADAFIIDAVRTPRGIGKQGKGALSHLHPQHLGATVLKALVDRNDFASFTSQESSNLVWGGFKYLENYELGLVRKLCKSRNRLIRAYPANIATIGFILTLDPTTRGVIKFASINCTAATQATTAKA